MADIQCEHMITITLSRELLQLTAKMQYKHSYKHLEKVFKTGKGCIEFTKQGNIHYHIKTQDPIDMVYAMTDNLKTIRFKTNDKKYNVFGFTKIDETQHTEYYEDYDYLLKNIEQTECIFKRLKMDTRALWDYTETNANINIKSKPKIDLRSLISLDNIESDTEIEVMRAKLV